MSCFEILRGSTTDNPANKALIRQQAREQTASLLIWVPEQARLSYEREEWLAPHMLQGKDCASHAGQRHVLIMPAFSKRLADLKQLHSLSNGHGSNDEDQMLLTSIRGTVSLVPAACLGLPSNLSVRDASPGQVPR